eukprot:365169-Chlamydomonas_euryale.AAC.5
MQRAPPADLVVLVKPPVVQPSDVCQVRTRVPRQVRRSGVRCPVAAQSVGARAVGGCMRNRWVHAQLVGARAIGGCARNHLRVHAQLVDACENGVCKLRNGIGRDGSRRVRVRVQARQHKGRVPVPATGCPLLGRARTWKRLCGCTNTATP